MSVTKGKRCIELAGKNEESEHFERHRGFPDMEYDGKKSMTAIGKTLKILVVQFDRIFVSSAFHAAISL